MERTAVPTPDDDGLFGPGSVTWRIMARPEIWVGGLRAAYLQALHPRVMRGTWQNTAFADRGGHRRDPVPAGRA
jgi:uncharacterized protein (DUF2236 family)